MDQTIHAVLSLVLQAYILNDSEHVCINPYRLQWNCLYLVYMHNCFKKKLHLCVYYLFHYQTVKFLQQYMIFLMGIKNKVMTVMFQFHYI